MKMTSQVNRIGLLIGLGRQNIKESGTRMTKKSTTNTGVWKYFSGLGSSCSVMNHTAKSPIDSQCFFQNARQEVISIGFMALVSLLRDAIQIIPELRKNNRENFGSNSTSEKKESLGTNYIGNGTKPFQGFLNCPASLPGYPPLRGSTLRCETKSLRDKEEIYLLLELWNGRQS